MSEKRIAVCDDEKIIADHLAEIVRKCIASRISMPLLP